MLFVQPNIILLYNNIYHVAIILTLLMVHDYSYLPFLIIIISIFKRNIMFNSIDGMTNLAMSQRFIFNIFSIMRCERYWMWRYVK